MPRTTRQMKVTDVVRAALSVTGQPQLLAVKTSSGREHVGRVVRMPNTHMPRVDPRQGGSNMLIVFEDGTEIPCEVVQGYKITA